MNKTVYQLMKNSAEIRFPHRASTATAARDVLKPGCTLDGNDLYPVEIKRFPSKEDALKALAACGETFVRVFDRFFEVEEFYVEENVYSIDEDGDEDFVECAGVWEYSPMPSEILGNGIRLVWCESGEYAEAEE